MRVATESAQTPPGAIGAERAPSPLVHRHGPHFIQHTSVKPAQYRIYRPTANLPSGASGGAFHEMATDRQARITAYRMGCVGIGDRWVDMRRSHERQRTGYSVKNSDSAPTLGQFEPKRRRRFLQGSAGPTAMEISTASRCVPLKAIGATRATCDLQLGLGLPRFPTGFFNRIGHQPPHARLAQSRRSTFLGSPRVHRRIAPRPTGLTKASSRLRSTRTLVR